MTTPEPTVHQLFDLAGKVALITGGTGYLGTAFSRALAEVGASIVISSRDRDRAHDRDTATDTDRPFARAGDRDRDRGLAHHLERQQPRQGLDDRVLAS